MDFPILLQKLLLGKEAIVLGIFRTSGAYPVHALWVKKNKGEIIHEKHKVFSSLKAFASEQAVLERPVPIVLCIDNEHIVLENNEEAVAVFDLDSFHVQRSQSFEFFAIIRQSQLEDYLNELGDVSSRVLSVSLGPVMALNWVENTELESPYPLGDQQISVDAGTIQWQLLEEEKDVILENERLSSYQLSLLLVAFEFFINPVESISDRNSSALKDFLFGKTLNKILLFGGMGLFFLFLVSTGLFFYFQSANEELSEAYYEQNLIQTKADNYSKEIIRLEKILNTSGRQAYFSRIATDIALSVPSDISLKALDIYPIELGELKRNKRIRTLPHVEITGQSYSIRNVANWVSEIKDLSWVADIVKHEIDRSDDGYIINLVILIRHVE